MKVVIIGTGYVGLVTGCCLADIGVNVVCVDIDRNKIDNLNNGILPIFEPGLEEIVKRNLIDKRLSFSVSLQSSLLDANVIFIAVGTPPNENGDADMKYVYGVAKEIGTYIKGYAVIVTKSTVPVGSSVIVKAAIKDEICRRNLDIEFDVVSNPEFLKEGAAIKDFMSPDRIVIGIENDRAKKVMDMLYKPFLLNGYRIIYMDVASAEMTKYAANAMLATRISFMNDIANLCERVGANINFVRSGISSDPRIGKHFLYAGIGYGGSCFPKDVKALINIGEQNGCKLEILNSVEAINNRQKHVIFKKVKDCFGNNLASKNIAVWGLAFKPNTDDLREAPSLVLINELIKSGASVRVFDPIAMREAKTIFNNSVSWCEDIYESTQGADAIILVTEWNEFRLPDWEKLKVNMNSYNVFDGRNIYDKSLLESLGFEYYGIGIS